MLFALLRFRLEGEADLGWHLAQGRLIAEGHWLRTNALAWSTPDEPWRDTSWLFDWLAYLTTRAFPDTWGPKLLVAGFTALTLGFLGLASLELSAQGAWVLPAFTLVILPRATPRPHVCTWAAMAATLWLVLRAWRLERERPADLDTRARAGRLRLWTLLPLWLGVQLHAGAFFAAALLGFFSLEAWLGSRDWRALLPPALAPLCLIAGPDGVAPLVHLLRHWNLDDVLHIQEFQRWRPSLEPQLPFVALVALAGPLLQGLRERGRRAPQPGDPLSRRLPIAPAALFVSSLVFLALALRYLRCLYELAVVASPSAALLVEALSARTRPQTARLAAVLVTVAAFIPQGIFSMFFSIQLTGAWDERRLSVRAARFLDAQQIDGPGFNSLADGGYLSWVRPEARVFLDARIHAYPVSLWREVGEAEKSRPAFDRFLRERGALWALTARHRERMGGFRMLEGDPGWALVYWDDVNALYLRRDQPRFAAAINSFEYKLFHPWGDLLGQIAAAPPETLRAFDLETLRFLSTTPNDPTALLIACASGLRQRLGDAGVRCDLAESAARDSEPALLPRLRDLRAAGESAR